MTSSKAQQAGFTGWQWRALVAYSLLIFLFCMAASLSHMARASGLLRDWVVEPYLITDTPDGVPLGWVVVKEAPSDGAAARAGIREGDFVRSEVFGVLPPAILAPGVHLPVTVDRGGSRFTTEIVTPEQPPIPTLAAFVLASQGLAGIVWATLGFVLLLKRGRRDRAAASLGMLMQCLAFTAGGFGYLWAFAPSVVQLQVVLGSAAGAGICLFLPLAGMELAGGGQGQRERRLVRNVSAALAASASGSVIAVFLGHRYFNVLLAGAILLAAALCSWCIARNYRQIDARARNRIKIVLAAFGSYLVSFGLFFLFVTVGLSIHYLWAIVGSVLSGLIGPTLIAYAMLRRRLFDFGFAVNRTLVYGAAAFTLLVTFGLVEYGAKSMIPVAWPTAGPFISAGLAVLLFLMFHRLHHWFEHHIERLFFSSWQQAEAALKRFVHSAGHYEQVSALCRDFTGELERFSGGAAAALYLRGDSGGFELQAGKVPGAAKSYAEDGRGFALMRTERKPIDLARADHPLPGALALPMLDQGRLLGFVLVGAKPDGAHYRPDEIENLNWAVHQVGFDIRALHARLLEDRVGQLAGEVSSLSNERDRAITDRDRVISALASGRPTASGT